MTGPAASCLGLLRRRRQSIATAESLTCGLIAATLASVPGASAVLRGGLAAYATDVKTSVLGVDPGLVEAFGVVSGECVEAMAARARIVFATDWAVASSGVAGPDRQEGHPVGTVFVAVEGPDTRRIEALRLPGERNEIRAATVHAALALLESMLTAGTTGREEPERP